jgi:hypothetical protein
MGHAMAASTERASAVRMASVLIPVVVGSLLGLGTSIATKYYDSSSERAEIVRKENTARLERVMTLSARYLSDVAKALSIGMLRNGNVGADDLTAMSAPTDTLTELSVVVSLYFPNLRGDVEQIYAAHQAMMLNYDDIIGVRAKRPDEDAVAYEQRIRKALAPSTDRVRALMGKIAAMARPEGA